MEKAFEELQIKKVRFGRRYNENYFKYEDYANIF